jgi:diacylglycerol kinase family enzyme
LGHCFLFARLIPGIHHVQARGITIYTESEQEVVTLDGEVYAQTPVKARVADERMRFIVPQDQSKSASRDINVRKQ